MNVPSISARGLGKQYTFQKGESAWKQFFARLRGAESNRFWALRNVTFDVREGEVVGIIGRNGSGKSTLLKVLSRVTRPSEGSARLYGRFSSLLELGAGFHGDLTGRENIYFNGAMLGMANEECNRNFDAIVDFSGLGEFIDTPVKRYSSGMYIRLAFSVAAFLRSEILIIDEVLSVGDIAFQAKALARLRKVVVEEGRIVLFVSHDLGAVSGLCSRVLMIEKGAVAFDGPADAGIAKYLAAHSNRISLVGANMKDRLNRCTGKVLFTEVECGNGDEAWAWATRRGSTPVFQFRFKVVEDVPSMSFLFRLEAGGKVMSVANGLVSASPLTAGETGVVRIEFPEISLAPNYYSIYAILMQAHQEQAYDVVDGNVDLPALVIEDPDGPHVNGLFRPRYSVSCGNVAAGSAYTQ